MATTLAPTNHLDLMRLQVFNGRLLSDFGTALTVLAGGIGDRLGLFASLASGGPQTSADLALASGCDPRLVRPWLQCMAAAGYLDYHLDGELFSLPAEHSMLANLDADSGLGGGFQLFLGLAKPMEQLLAAFETHNGVDQSAYDTDLRSGMERMSAPWFESMLIETWLPAAGLGERLRQGIRVADIGCARGRALFRMARSYPRSSFIGYDRFAPVVAEAMQRARDLELHDRVQFAQHDIAEPLPAQYDLITLFNALHDITPAVEGLRRVREALAPGGICLILESAFSDRLEDNISSLGSVLYGTSLLYNTPVSIAQGTQEPGGAALPDGRIRELCGEAGLELRRLRLPNPIHALYLAS